MPSTPTLVPAASSEQLQPGHALILEPGTEGTCRLACACGGLIEPQPASQAAQLARHQAHLSELLAEQAPQ
ncbi:hypothetical protein ABZ864_40785 [Streptomyces sp. NPDC047082]|uniref:hypothetical protein n=1 Tax=Streptomyces sp. NPDC047082 TaxID=3155259 RepID=UPI0033D4DE38